MWSIDGDYGDYYDRFNAEAELTGRDQAELAFGKLHGYHYLRQIIGALPSNESQSVRLEERGRPLRKIVLLGHDFNSDIEYMEKKLGFSMKEAAGDYCGVIDTVWLARDIKHESFPKGLSGLAGRYTLAKMKWSQPRFKKGEFEFEGAHNPGNDAVMTIKSALAMGLDKSINSYGQVDKSSCITGPIENIEIQYECEDDVILICLDLESQEHEPRAVTEICIAWIDLAEAKGTHPGKNGIGWHKFIHARHMMFSETWGYRNKNFVVGNPFGFDRQYGRTERVTKANCKYLLRQQFEDLSHKRLSQLRATQRANLQARGSDTGSSAAESSGATSVAVDSVIFPSAQPTVDDFGFESLQISTLPNDEEIQDIMSSVCPNEMNGRKCGVPSGKCDKLSLCQDYAHSRCSHHPFEHDRLYHIKATCFRVQRGKKCNNPKCK